MFESIVEAAHEIVVEIGAEVAHYPMRMIAEVVQFLLLVGIVWVVGVGFGKRRGFVANMLSERLERTRVRLDEASHAGAALQAAKHDAGVVTRDARAEARGIVAQAKHDAEELIAAAHAEVDAECQRIEERAELALATELQEMQLELREQLVELVSSATRAIMNEKLTVSEQRKLIEESIAGSISASKDSSPRHAVLAGAAQEEA